MKIVLLEPEIPQNTGNIARLAAALGAELWLVGRLGFSLTEKQIRRAGMDYWDKVSVVRIPTLEEYYEQIHPESAFISSKGAQIYTQIPANTEALVFGNESSGLPLELYDRYPDKLFRIPMAEGIRCINLSSAVAVTAYHLAMQGKDLNFNLSS
jgi:tRNA (cytidine/uridine-2'-O-)-methyltransferase